MAFFVMAGFLSSFTPGQRTGACPARAWGWAGVIALAGCVGLAACGGNGSSTDDSDAGESSGGTSAAGTGGGSSVQGHHGICIGMIVYRGGTAGEIVYTFPPAAWDRTGDTPSYDSVALDLWFRDLEGDHSGLCQEPSFASEAAWQGYLSQPGAAPCVCIDEAPLESCASACQRLLEANPAYAAGDYECITERDRIEGSGVAALIRGIDQSCAL